MKIAVVSDTHSRTPAILRALELIRERGLELIVHCGDLEDAAAVLEFPAHTHFVFGNCDHDRNAIRRAVGAIGATLHEPFGNLEVAGKTLAFIHGDDSTMLRDLIISEAFDFVFHGHTHARRDETIGRTRVINPGALHRAKPKTFAVLDLATGELETVEVD